MVIHSFIRGIMIGISMAVPVGPLGILCMRRSIAYGGLAGLISGFGVATADAFYAILASFGVGFVQRFLLEHQCVLVLLGCIVLSVIGARSFFAKPIQKKEKITGGNLVALYFSAFFLTISNPITLLAFMALMAGLGLDLSTWSSSVAVAAGVFTGSACSWLVLSLFMGLLHTRISTQTIARIHAISGAVLIAFALGLLLARYDCLVLFFSRIF